MPHSVNGFGTTYYGEADHWSDGSYVTTEWIIAALFPVVPLRSLRIRRRPERDQAYVVYTSEGFEVYEHLPRRWGQIAKTYLFACFVPFYIAGAFALCMWKVPHDTGLEVFLMFLVFAFLAGLPWVGLGALRKLSRAHAPQPPQPTAPQAARSDEGAIDQEPS